jgi:hypothetical protein
MRPLPPSPIAAVLREFLAISFAIPGCWLWLLSGSVVNCVSTWVCKVDKTEELAWVKGQPLMSGGLDRPFAYCPTSSQPPPVCVQGQKRTWENLPLG